MINPGISALLLGLIWATTTAAETPLEVAIEGAWLRAMPPSQTTTAAYLSLTNQGTQDLQITGASVELADQVEIHRSRDVDGYQRMERLAGLFLGVGQTVNFTPGGTHLMVMGLERMPAEGTSVRLCIEFGTSATVCTQAVVRRSTPPAGQHHRHP